MLSPEQQQHRDVSLSQLYEDLNPTQILDKVWLVTVCDSVLLLSPVRRSETSLSTNFFLTYYRITFCSSCSIETCCKSQRGQVRYLNQ